MTPTRDTVCFLFDLGGVLLRLADPKQAMAWVDGRVTAEQMQELWHASPLIDRFERGECSEVEFAEYLIEQFDLPWQPTELIAEFDKVIVGPFAGARELILELGRHGRVACLSNTNHPHWRKIRREMNILDVFDQLFPSHLIKCRKPDSRAFATVVESLGIEPGNFYFFDDTEANVEAARRFGMNACQVEGVEGVRDALKTAAAMGLNDIAKRDIN